MLKKKPFNLLNKIEKYSMKQKCGLESYYKFDKYK